MNSGRRLSDVWRPFLAAALVLGMSCCQSGCRSGGEAEPEAKARLAKLLRLYQVYVEKHHKGPPNEQALRAFGHKLSAKERDEYLIGDDLESIFISPRDQQPYEIRYNLKLEPGGATRAVAWEAAGQAGKRFVALTNLYVEEYDDETFKEYNK
jgi:hypothetical protein